MDVFHAERFKCSSQYLFQASGVDFVSIAEQQTNKPRIDYFISESENSNVHTILADMLIADAFSKGKTLWDHGKLLMSGRAFLMEIVSSEDTFVGSHVCRLDTAGQIFIPDRLVHRDSTLQAGTKHYTFILMENAE